MGLIQREIEKVGIATVGISIVREYSKKVKPPRTVFVRWPFGHPLGEVGNILQQRTIVREALAAIYEIKSPGQIIDLPYRWRRERYSQDQPLSINNKTQAELS